MTQTRDLIKKMADFFTGEEFYEKGEEARLELSPDDIRCMCEIIKALPPVKPQEPKTDVLDKIKAEIQQVVEEEADDERWSRGLHYALKIIDKYTGKER